MRGFPDVSCDLRRNFLKRGKKTFRGALVMPNSSIEKKGERRYLGSAFTACAAVLCPCFLIGPIIFAIIALKAEISVSTILLSFMCFSCSFLWTYFGWKNETCSILGAYLQTARFMYPYCLENGFRFHIIAVKDVVSVFIVTLF